MKGLSFNELSLSSAAIPAAQPCSTWGLEGHTYRRVLEIAPAVTGKELLPEAEQLLDRGFCLLTDNSSVSHALETSISSETSCYRNSSPVTFDQKVRTTMERMLY